jgi:hypothetical protein
MASTLSLEPGPSGRADLPALVAPPPGYAALTITPTGATNPSDTSGGAVRIDASAADGVALEVFTSHAGSATGRLISINQTNAAFNRNVMIIQATNASLGLALTRPAVSRGDVGNPPPSSNLLSVNVLEPTNNDDTNVLDSAVGIGGFELNRGTVKITHNRPTNGAANVDSSASAISIVVDGSGTTAKAIHADTHASMGTGARLLDIRTRGAAPATGVVADQRLVLIDKGSGAGNGNLLLFGASEPATGAGGVSIPNAGTAPAAVPNQGTLYVLAGVLRYRGPTTDVAIVGP